MKCAVCLRLLLLFCCGLLGACSSYALRGRVVEGPRPGIELVHQDDPRLTQEHGVAEAFLQLTLDPNRLSKKVVGRATSGSDGTFVMPVDAFGSGVLMHEVELDARRTDFLDSKGTFMLPGGKTDRRVLVTVVTGKQKRFDERSLLDRTMDEAEVYLRE